MIANHASFEQWLSDPSMENRSTVIEAHQYLCRRAARKFLRRGVERADLEQVAAVGLIKAVDRYDALQGTPFEAYAWRLVLGELMHYVRDIEHAVRTPRRLRELKRKVLDAEQALCASLGREPTPREVGAYLGLGVGDQREVALFRESGNLISVEDLKPSESRRLSYTIDTQIEVSLLVGSFSVLNPLERTIIQAIYEHDMGTVALAKQLGYSRRHIARLHVAALRKLLCVVGPARE